MAMAPICCFHWHPFRSNYLHQYPIFWSPRITYIYADLSHPPPWFMCVHADLIFAWSYLTMYLICDMNFWFLFHFWLVCLTSCYLVWLLIHTHKGSGLCFCFILIHMHNELWFIADSSTDVWVRFLPSSWYTWSVFDSAMFLDSHMLCAFLV